jgi:hypothetical protein
MARVNFTACTGHAFSARYRILREVLGNLGTGTEEVIEVVSHNHTIRLKYCLKFDLFPGNVFSPSRSVSRMNHRSSIWFLLPVTSGACNYPSPALPSADDNSYIHSSSPSLAHAYHTGCRTLNPS